MNEPVAKETKETHDDGITLGCLDPVTLFESVTNVESTRKDLTFSTTFAFRSGENAAKTSGKCGPRLAPSS